MEGNYRLLAGVICQEKMPLCWKADSVTQTVRRGSHVGAENLSRTDVDWKHVPFEDGDL